MAKNRTKQESAPKPTEPGPGKPAVWVRVVVSLLVAWHVFVVFVSPLSVQPASQLVADVAQSKFIRWYTDPLYLNHGYHFFGPEPPINHLVRYSVVDENGALVVEGDFPNNDLQSPRLFYHRHMMLADQAGLGPGDVAPEVWLRLTLKAYALHLLRENNGAEARIDYVRHNLLFPTQSQRGDDPNAADMFVREQSVRVTRADLDRPLGVPPRGDAGPELLPEGAAR